MTIPIATITACHQRIGLTSTSRPPGRGADHDAGDAGGQGGREVVGAAVQAVVDGGAVALPVEVDGARGRVIVPPGGLGEGELVVHDRSDRAPL